MILEFLTNSCDGNSNKHQVYGSSIFKKQIGHVRFRSISNLGLMFNSAARRSILSTTGEYLDKIK